MTNLPNDLKDLKTKTMPSFLPRTEPVRKRKILEKREDELRHQLKHNSFLEKVNRAAEKVREANLNLIKAQIHLDQLFRAEEDTSEKENRRKKLSDQTLIWKKRTIEEILELYDKNTS